MVMFHEYMWNYQGLQTEERRNTTWDVVGFPKKLAIVKIKVRYQEHQGLDQRLRSTPKDWFLNWFQFVVLPDRLISTPNCFMWIAKSLCSFSLFFGGWYQPASTHASTVRVPSTRRFSGKYQATLSVFPRIIFFVDESFWFCHSTRQAFAQRLNTNISQALSLTVFSTLLLARFKLISGFISIDKFGRLTRIYSKLRHYMKLQWLWDRKDLGNYAGQKSKTWHRQVSHSMIIKQNVGIIWYRSQ